MRRTKFTSDEFRKLIDGVADDLGYAAIHYRLYRDILSSYADFGRALRESPTFWNVTAFANRDAAVFRLCRVYEDHQQSLNLCNWLKAIRNNLGLFDIDKFRRRTADNPFIEALAAGAQKPDQEMLEADIEWLGSDAAAKKLTVLRNNVFVHLSPRQALGASDFIDSYPLTADEIWELILRGLKIVNRYSKMFHAKTYSLDVVGSNDFVAILQAVEEHIRQRDRAIRAQ